jgi:phosphoribosylformimino-5-aminoimidazole carboxamide ribotide isomerase
VEVIPVLDVWQGKAVKAEGGDRTRYAPVQSVLAGGSEPLVLARAFRARLGLERLYLAELDAIASTGEHLGGAVALVGELAREGLRVWVDAGVSAPSGIQALLACGARRIVVGLETLADLESLPDLVKEFGAERLAFSLDLFGERPITTLSSLAGTPATEIARVARQAGFSTLIVLDLARVGKRTGFAVRELAHVRSEIADATWVAGGGARHAADLEAVARVGFQACLVGTALYDGAIGRKEIECLAELSPPMSQSPASESKSVSR